MYTTVELEAEEMNLDHVVGAAMTLWNIIADLPKTNL